MPGTIGEALLPKQGLISKSVIPAATFLQIFDLAGEVGEPASRGKFAPRAVRRDPG
jgi:hypothetical protein